MRRLLIIAPHFAPTNAADGQRVRMYLRHFRANGWEPTVLAVAPECVRAPVDPFLLGSLPDDVEVLRVRVPTLRWLGDTLGRRALWPLYRAARTLASTRRFDLAYLSTTQFLCFALGPWLRRRHALPYVLDYQDPWHNDYYQRSGVAPPGGRLRFALASLENRLFEQRCVGQALGLTTVSTDYVAALASRLPRVPPSLFLPFGAEPDDFARARREAPVAPPDDGASHWVYVGRGGADMWPALRPLFAALRQTFVDDPARRSRLRLHFIGTSYAAADRATGSLTALIAEYGLADVVEEAPQRIPFSDALRWMDRADALLLPNSDDRSYNPSKLALCLVAGKPLLLLAGADSHAARTVAGLAGICTVDFRDPAAVAAIRTGFIDQLPPAPSADDPRVVEQTAERRCATLCQWFGSLLARTADAS